MKLAKYILTTAVAAWSLSACDMNPEIYSQPTVDGYAKSAKEVNTLLIGTYGTMHDVLYYEWALTELRSDNARMRVNNSTSAETKLLEQLDQNTVLSAHAWLDTYWTAAYAVIAGANDVLSKLDVVTNEQLYAQYRGEALFLRSLNYFNLVRLWGPVFKVTTKLSAAESRVLQRSASEEIYDLIESDLRLIVEQELLPKKYAEDQTGRATLDAARTLLAEVLLTRYTPGDAEYAEAQTLLHQVIVNAGNPQSGSALVPYDKVFAIDNEMNAEIIFAIRYMAGNKGVGSPFGGLFGPSNNGNNVIMGSPKHYNYPSNDLLELFKQNPADKRIAVTYAEQYYNKTTGKWVTDPSLARYVTKFLSPVKTEYDGENDWPIFRLGDILLLYAEATAELAGAPTAEAVQYLNMTRERAGIPTYSLSDFGSLTEFRNALRDERRLETAFENKRYFDLQRWGITVPTVNNFFATESFFSEYNYEVQPIQSWQTMLPIPVSVLNINPDIAQNIGY